MKEIEFNVEGMMCSGCENRVKNSLSLIGGVEAVEASFETGVVKITLTKEVLEKELKEAIEDLGYKVK